MQGRGSQRTPASSSSGATPRSPYLQDADAFPAPPHQTDSPTSAPTLTRRQLPVPPSVPAALPRPPLPTPPQPQQQTSAGPRSIGDQQPALPVPPHRQRSVRDLSRKQCWVCYGSSDEETPGEKKQQWVHACKCTLVAHPQCLLEWVSQYQTTHREPPHCPVCSEPYLIREERSVILEYYKRVLRRVDKTSLMLAVSGGVGAVWAASSAYSVWACRMFMGDTLTQALLMKNSWPLSYYVNLPLIPITLILARTPLVDSLLPFLPLTLILSSSSPSRSLTFYPADDPFGFQNLSFSYPPSPTLTLCLLPWFRIVYLRARKRVFESVLGRTTKYTGLAGLMAEMEEAELDGDGGGPRLEVVAEVEVEFEENEDGGEEAVQQPQPRQERMRVGLSRMTNLVVGALLFPALSAGAGAALFWLASRPGNSAALRLLRRILGVSAIIAAGGRSSFPNATSSSATWLKILSGITTSQSTTSLIDPVWLRNTIGGGLVLLLRDAVQLTAGVLEMRRKASRRVMSRPFDDSLELDGNASSGGVDGRGRPAVVHTML